MKPLSADISVLSGGLNIKYQLSAECSAAQKKAASSELPDQSIVSLSETHC